MDLTPGFLDRWREHRDLQYLDHVRAVLDEALLDEPWLETARRRARALEAAATLRLAGVDTREPERVEAVLDGSLAGELPEALWYASAHDLAMAAAEQQGAVTPALLADLHARLSGGREAGGESPRDGALAALCDRLVAPSELHPAVTAAITHLELLRLRPWSDGNARTARLLLLLLLVREGYGYRGLLAPSTHWEDPRRLPDQPAVELPPEQAETDRAVERIVHNLHAAVRDMINRARAEEHTGSLASAAFGWPIQP